jgi:hypothetical protein
VLADTVQNRTARQHAAILCSSLTPQVYLLIMVESDHAEERLARVERMLAQCRRESAALKAIAASKVVVVVVDATPALDAVRPPQKGRTLSAVRFDK